MYELSSDASHFQTNQLSVGQHGEFLWILVWRPGGLRWFVANSATIQDRTHRTTHDHYSTALLLSKKLTTHHTFKVCVSLFESQSNGPALNLLLNGRQNLLRKTSIGHKMTFFSFQFACLWWRLRLMRRQLMHVYSENLPHLTDLHHFLTKQCRLLTLIRYLKKIDSDFACC